MEQRTATIRPGEPLTVVAETIADASIEIGVDNDELGLTLTSSLSTGPKLWMYHQSEANGQGRLLAAASLRPGEYLDPLLTVYVDSTDRYPDPRCVTIRVDLKRQNLKLAVHHDGEIYLDIEEYDGASVREVSLERVIDLILGRIPRVRRPGEGPH